MEGGAFVTEALFAGTERTKVFDSLRNNFAVKLYKLKILITKIYKCYFKKLYFKFNAAEELAIRRNLEKNFRTSHLNKNNSENIL